MIPEFIGRLPVARPAHPARRRTPWSTSSPSRNAPGQAVPASFSRWKGRPGVHQPRPCSRSPRSFRQGQRHRRPAAYVSIVEEIMLEIMFERLPDRSAKEKGRFVVTPRSSAKPRRHASAPAALAKSASERKKSTRPTPETRPRRSVRSNRLIVVVNRLR